VGQNWKETSVGETEMKTVTAYKRKRGGEVSGQKWQEAFKSKQDWVGLDDPQRSLPTPTIL